MVNVLLLAGVFVGVFVVSGIVGTLIYFLVGRKDVNDVVLNFSPQEYVGKDIVLSYKGSDIITRGTKTLLKYRTEKIFADKEEGLFGSNTGDGSFIHPENAVHKVSGDDGRIYHFVLPADVKGMLKAFDHKPMGKLLSVMQERINGYSEMLEISQSVHDKIYDAIKHNKLGIMKEDDLDKLRLQLESFEVKRKEVDKAMKE